MRFVLVLSALAISSSAASADDLQGRFRTFASQQPNWAGLHIGLKAGYGRGVSKQKSIPTVLPDGFADGRYAVQGGVVGATVGYRWQLNDFVIGLEGDYGWSTVKGSTLCGTSGGRECGTDVRSAGSIRGQVGLSRGEWLFYGTGGLAVADVNAYDLHDPQSGSKIRSGWTIGAGVEWKISRPWSVKLEYLYGDFGKVSHFTSAGHTPEKISLKTNFLRLGVNYHFEASALPVVAKY